MRTVVVLAFVWSLWALPAVAQGRHWPTPPQPAETTQPAANPAASTMKLRIDSVQLQREARELSDLANSLPADMQRVSHGLLPKDTIDKLKRIEKLSKHLRGEISP